jgi:hypothetical protein
MWGRAGTPFMSIGTVDRDNSERKAPALIRATEITTNHEELVFPRRRPPNCSSDITLLNHLPLCYAVPSPYNGHFSFHNCFCQLSILASCLYFFRNINIYTQNLTLPIRFDPEYGGSRYLRNVGKYPIVNSRDTLK